MKRTRVLLVDDERNLLCAVKQLLEENGMEDLINKFKGSDATVPIIILTGHGTMDLAVKSRDRGSTRASLTRLGHSDWRHSAVRRR
jgi:FixJ family two-component response regulator